MSISNKSKTSKTFSTFFSPSRRLNLTYLVFFIWIALAIFGIIMEADLYALAVYFTSGLPIIIGYLWAETSRPSLKDAAEIVKNIKGRPNNNKNNPYNPYNPYNPHHYNEHNENTFDQSYDQIDQSDQTDQFQTEQFSISIYANDASVELKVNQDQLSTFMNLGYVDIIADKYTFKKSDLDQIKSLLDQSTQDPII